MNKGYVKVRGREVSLKGECYWIMYFEGILHSRRWKDVWIIYYKETEESPWNTRKQTASSHWDTKEAPGLTLTILSKLVPDDIICIKKVDLIFIDKLSPSWSSTWGWVSLNFAFSSTHPAAQTSSETVANQQNLLCKDCSTLWVLSGIA